MSEKEELIKYYTSRSWFSITKQPLLCPFCARVFSPRYIADVDGKIFSDGTKITLLVFQCQHCKNIGVGQYKQKRLDLEGEPIYEPINDDYFFPEKTFSPKDFDASVQGQFPDFVSAYQEAEKAQNIGCKNLAGMGYRKAVEILVKDFAQILAPYEGTQIRKKRTSEVINDYFSFDKEFWTMAKGAWVLGNDYAHYKKKYEDKDIYFLKKVVDLLYAEIIKRSLLDELTPIVESKKINFKE